MDAGRAPGAPRQPLGTTPLLLRSNRPGVLYAALIVIFAAVLFGGASRLDILPPIAARIAAVLALVYVVWTTPAGALRVGAGAAALLLALIALPLAQLVPLPWDLWTALPGRDHAREVYEALGTTPWQPISLTPDRTFNGLLALLPAIAAFVIGTRLDTDGRDSLLRIVALLAIASGLIGLIQLAGGPDNMMYFYAITNRDSSVGVFSNANHHALFLCVGIVLVCGWLAGIAARGGKPSPAQLAVATVGVAILVASLVGTFSRAGLALGAIAFAGGGLLLPLGRMGVPARVRILVVALPALALLVGVVLAVTGLLGENFATEQRSDERLANIPLFARITADHLPFGSGFGSFDPIFRGYETVESLGFAYLNNAHNDYAQVAIEAGLAGIALIAAFFVWFLPKVVRAWTSPADSDRASRHAKTASLLILLMLVHSAVDYPLRTAALSAIFALACALLTEAASAQRQAIPRRTES